MTQTQRAPTSHSSVSHSKFEQEDKRNRILAWLVTSLGLTGFLLVFIPLLQKSARKTTPPSTTVKEVRLVYHVNTENKLNYYVSDGDYWITQQHWKNAAHQYEIAHKKAPERYDVLYRLAYANAQLCLHKHTHCTAAQLSFEKLIQHPSFEGEKWINIELSKNNYAALLRNFSPIDHWSHMKKRKHQNKIHSP